MASIDSEDLLASIDAGAPTGPDLEYDPAFIALEDALRARPEQQFGDVVVAEEAVDWGEVLRLAVEILTRSKDLRAAVYLTQALARLQHLAGLAQGLALIRGLLERYWDTLHPQLDPDDDLDPTARTNAILSLCDPEQLLSPLRGASFLTLPGLGGLSLRTVQIAKGEIAAPADEEETLHYATIEAALADIPFDNLQTVIRQVNQSIADIAQIEGIIVDKSGINDAVSLGPLTQVLQEIKHFLDEQGRRLGPAIAEAEIANGAADSDNNGLPGSARPAAGKPRSDVINSREDVIAALDKIVVYYQKQEPASPVPLLLQRAKRLVAANFIELLRDLAPDALVQVEKITGTTADNDV